MAAVRVGPDTERPGLADELDRLPWWLRVGLGVVVVPVVLLGLVGVLWGIGLALRPVIGPGGPLAEHQVAVTVVLWVALPLAVAALVLAVRHHRRPPLPTAPVLARDGRDGPEDVAPVRAGPPLTTPVLARDGRDGPEDVAPVGVGPGASTPVLARDGRDGPEDVAPVGVGTGASGARRVVEAALGLVAALVVVWPFTTSPGDDRWVGAFDAPYNAWLGWRIGEAMRSGTWLPTTVPDALWPAGIDLLVTDGLLPAFVTGLLNLVGFGPYVAYDLTLLVGVVLSIWAGRRLALILTDRRLVALAGGIAFAAAPVMAAPVQAHVAFVWSFTVPLLVRRAILDARGQRSTAERWRRRAAPDGLPSPWPLAGLLVLAFACSAYHLVFGGLAYLLVGLAWPGSALRRAPALARTGAAVAVAALVLSPFLVARWSFEADERAAGGGDQTRVADALLLSADGLAVVAPPDELAIDLPVPEPSLGPAAFASLRIAFPGFLLLAGAGVAVTLRRRGALALVGSAGVLWVLSLGPALHVGGRYPVDDALIGSTAWLPFRLLLEVPGLGNLRAPYRASYAIAALLAAATVLALDAVLAHLDGVAEARAQARHAGRAGSSTSPLVLGSDGGPAVVDARAADAESDAAAAGTAPSGSPPPVHIGVHVGVAAVVVALLALSVLGPLPTSDLGLADEQRAALEAVADRGQPGEAVVIVPFGCRLDDPRVIALQLVHGQPSLGCSTSRAATPWSSGLDAWQRSEGLRALWCGEPAVGAVFDDPDDVAPLDPASLADLRAELGVRFVVVEAGGMEAVRCPWLAPGLEVLAGSAEVIGEGGGWVVYDLGPVPGVGGAGPG